MVKKLNDKARAVKIGDNIRAKRDQLEKSRSYVGDYLGVTQQMVDKYERGLGRVSAVTLWKLAELFGCSVGEFFK